MNTRVAVLLSGHGSNMMNLVEQAQGYNVVLVASDKPDAPGLVWATNQGMRTFALSLKHIGKPAYEAALDQALLDAQVQVIALAGYMRLLSPAFVARWRGRILNIHPSLLPRYKGLDTHARAIAAGDAKAGCSVHLVTEELDAGAVLGQARVPILAGDTADTLAARVLVEEHRLYPRILSEYCRTMPASAEPAPLDRVRQVALQLPEAEERADDGETTFLVAGEPFAAVRDGRAMRVRGTAGWEDVDLAGDVDWPAIDDRIARGWELVAPAELLEAGGR